MMIHQAKAALNAHNLGYQTPDGQILLQGVSLSLMPGTICAIAGPNGAGKTTLLHLLSGLQAASSGEVLLNGTNINRLTIKARARQIALVTQKSAPDKRLSIWDYVALGQLPIWADYSAQQHITALKEILTCVGLMDIAHKSMGKISGGEQQRAHIARALAQKSKFLFLDEPTNHLDPDAKGRILSLVAMSGLTIIMILHDLVMIPEFASHIALMKDTRLVAFGPVAEVQTPAAIKQVFGVDYHLFSEANRCIPALDIQKTTEIYHL